MHTDCDLPDLGRDAYHLDAVLLSVTTYHSYLQSNQLLASEHAFGFWLAAGQRGSVHVSVQATARYGARGFTLVVVVVVVVAVLIQIGKRHGQCQPWSVHA